MRYVFMLLLLLIVGGVAAVLAAPNYIDWNSQKTLIEEKLADAMGVPAVKLDGGITIKLFPAPYVHIDSLTVAPYQGETNIVELEQLTAEFGWSKIMALQLQAENINIDSLKVQLVRLDADNANYIAQRRSRRVSQPRSLYPLGGISNLVINNFAYSYENKQTEEAQTIVIPNVQLTAPSFEDTIVALAGTVNEAPFTIDAKLNLDSLRQIEVDVKTAIAESTAAFKGTIFDPFYQPMIKGFTNIKIANFNTLFEALSAPLPAFLKPYKDFAEITAKADVTWNDTNASVENLELTLPQGTIEGRLTSKQKGPNGRPMHDISLKSNDFNLDAFRAASSANAPKSSQTGPWSEALFDLSFLENNDFKVALENTGLKTGLTTFDNFDLKVNNENKTLMIEDVLMGLDQGTTRMNGQLKYSSTPNLVLNTRLNSVPLQKLLGSVVPMLAGSMSGTADFSAHGNSVQDMMNNLNGNGELKVTEGRLLKTDLKDMVTAMRQIFREQKSENDTPFSEMKLTFKIEEGVLRNDDFYLKSKKAAIKAEGKIDLADKTINYTINPQTEAGITDILVPVKVIGPLDSPKIVPVVTSTTGKAAAIGAVLGGPIGAAAGAMIGSAISENNKKPEAGTPAEGTESGLKPEGTAPTVEGAETESTEEGEALPFDLKNATPEEIRQYFEQEQEQD